MTLFEQADRTGTNPPIYSWILVGYTPTTRRKMIASGWKRVALGGLVTTDPKLAARTANLHLLAARSNGTHAVHGVPLRLTDPVREIIGE